MYLRKYCDDTTLLEVVLLEAIVKYPTALDAC
jgi:hypothetical protein